MDVFLLGAGRPAAGTKPAALKFIDANTRAMDWQLQSFATLPGEQKVTFLGGYDVGSVIANYPSIGFTVIPDWDNQSVLHTLLSAPFSRRAAMCAYSDTVFRPDVVRALTETNADVVYGVDSQWKQRYAMRAEQDMAGAETILFDGNTVEFTGLLSLAPDVVSHLRTLDEKRVGKTLLDLIRYLDKAGFSVAPFDVEGQWAEFNAPSDIAQFVLGTKAESLQRLRPLVTASQIGDQYSFTVTQWRQEAQTVLAQIQQQFVDQRLIIRSSSKGEDNWDASNAGGFESILDVDGTSQRAIAEAIQPVVDSYGEQQSGDDQVLVQPFLPNVQLSGVILTCALESGAPYYRFNFDDQTQSTESVTSGSGESLRTVIVSRAHPAPLATIAPSLVPVLDAVMELETLLGFDRLDIEFAVDTEGQVHIFQVRPITVDHSAYDVDPLEVSTRLDAAAARFSQQQPPAPHLHGSFTLFANMPDWNPAEIIGTHPRPLAFSLYRRLITDEVWATQRAEFGYKDVRPAPLIFGIAGQPYVDARTTLNSFLPAELAPTTAEVIAEAYLQLLRDQPHLHDKIEFDIAFTIWTPQFQQVASARLTPKGVQAEHISDLGDALKKITRTALSRLASDTAPIKALDERRRAQLGSALPAIDKAYAILDDCRRFGTLAFSHAARAGFVATTLLESLVQSGVLTDARRLDFMRSFHTVAGEFKQDRERYRAGELTLEELTSTYGHLRPGTYEITATAYHEDPLRYLVGEDIESDSELSPFEFDATELAGIDALIAEMGASVSSASFCSYLREAIQAREAVKFEFTRSLSVALDLIGEFAGEIGLDRHQVSYLDFSEIDAFKMGAVTAEQLQMAANQHKAEHAITSLIELPPVITRGEDLHCFERFVSQPNYVTLNVIEGAVIEVTETTEPASIQNKIVLIPSADPGYDWLFGQNITGLITKYGGANSHMAIRAAESGLPAAIGVGDSLFESITRMEQIQLDCANHLIRNLR